MKAKRYDPFEHIRYRRRRDFLHNIGIELSWIIPYGLVLCVVIYALSLI